MKRQSNATPISIVETKNCRKNFKKYLQPMNFCLIEISPVQIIHPEIDPSTNMKNSENISETGNIAKINLKVKLNVKKKWKIV